MEVIDKVNWYAVITASGSEQSFCEYLRKEMNLHAIYPQAERYFRIQKQDIYSLKPLSAGCIFVETQEDINTLAYLLNQQQEFPIQSLTQLSKDTQKELFQLLNEQYVLRMSRGIIVDRKNYIKEGPLQSHEQHIIKINRHKRCAELDFLLNDKHVLVGLEITEKR